MDAERLNKELEVPEDEAEQARGIIQFSVNDALEKMITLSDNNAALISTHTIGLSSVKDFLFKYGFSDSRGGEIGRLPTSTAKDMGLFFEKLYNHKLANTEYTKEMIELLKRQELNTIIPKYLPKTASVAHKTGAIDLFTHDAGIIDIPSNPYIIVTLSNTDSPPAAEERMARISKNIYDYFIVRSVEKKRESLIYASITVVVASIVLICIYKIKQ
jgi:beta-lactamase class A